MKNKTAFIIGGSGNIGLGVTKLFEKNNYKIIVLDKKNILKKHKNIFFENFELSNIYKIEKNLKKIIKKYGTPDTLVNASYPISSNWKKLNLKEIKLKYFIENVSLHLGSYYWITKLMADFMIKKKRGSIIMISSIYGIVSQDPEVYKNTNLEPNLIYPIIKAGINAGSKQLSCFYGLNNVRINTISPGGLDGINKASKLESDIFFKKNYLKKLSIKRFCTPEDVAQACLYLADDKKSSYITGQNFILDGGYTVK
jgi:NAD(P)-dependent dehydrogenase (short-subunit alcohol dehydrogenase family)